MTKFQNIAAALAAAQSQMGKATKDSENPHFRSKYADLGSVMDACLPALNACGIALTQPTGENELGRFVSTILIHEGGERLECNVPLILQKQDMQGYGSAVTYARRYGLMCMSGIAPEDDDGNAAAAAAAPKAEPKPAPVDHAKLLERLKAAIDKQATTEALAAWWNTPSVEAARASLSEEMRHELTAEYDAKFNALNKPIIDDEIPHI